MKSFSAPDRCVQINANFNMKGHELNSLQTEKDILGLIHQQQHIELDCNMSI